jgi:hypothetical protein
LLNTGRTNVSLWGTGFELDSQRQFIGKESRVIASGGAGLFLDATIAYNELLKKFYVNSDTYKYVRSDN